MSLHRLIYASRPFGFDAGVLAGILITARAHNARNDITGALICRSDIYLQLLEGPGDAVHATFDRIKQDDRHVEVKTLHDAPSGERIFGRWAMRHDPFTSWMWTRQEVQDGAVQGASALEAQAIFTRIASQPD